MQTSSFFYYRDRPGGIRISVGLPRFIKEAYSIPFLTDLAPRYFGVLPTPNLTECQTIFQQQLAELDPHDIHNRCVALVAPYEPVLLCFEKPPFINGHWCHRRAVAEWMEHSLNISVPECGSLFAF